MATAQNGVEPTVGEGLRTAFAGDKEVPDAVLKHFDNQTALPDVGIIDIPTSSQQFLANIVDGEVPLPAFSLSEEITEQPGGIKIQSEGIPELITFEPHEQPATPSMDDTFSLSNEISSVLYNNQNQGQQQRLSSTHSNTTGMSIVSAPQTTDQKYSDITSYLNLPQSEAAKKLGIPPSTLSKRWREAAPKRKWPYRTVSKIDKEITTLLHNIPPDGQIPKEIEDKLSILIAKRKQELKQIVIRL